MPVNYPIWFAGSVLFIVGTVGLGLTHFGLVAGFRWITPIIWAGAGDVYLASLGLRTWWIFPITGALFFVLFLEIVYYNAWGLGSIL